LVVQAWQRVPNRRFTVVGDAGFDSEYNHELARQKLGLRSIIPPRTAWKTRRPPMGHWRRRMIDRRLLGTKRGRRHSGFTQRWQVETVMSMIKRNLGSALRGKSPGSRQRDMRLKVLTHNLMILRRKSGVETEQDSHLIQNQCFNHDRCDFPRASTAARTELTCRHRAKKPRPKSLSDESPLCLHRAESPAPHPRLQPPTSEKRKSPNTPIPPFD